MSTQLSSTKTVTYPDFTPPPVAKKPNKFVTAFQNTVDFLGAISNMVAGGMIVALLVIANIGFAQKYLHVNMPEWINTAGMAIGMGIGAIVGLALLAIGVGTPFVVAALISENRSVRHNKTALSDWEYLQVVNSLKALGFEGADKLVGSGVLNAEAYLRVKHVAAEIARKQGMSEAEVQHHSHNIGLIMFPDVAALEREVPLIRALNDRGVTDANAALAAASEPQYSVFAVPVSDEEVLASLEPADPKYGGNWEDISILEEKMARGHKLTQNERRRLNGAKASAGSFGDSAGKFLFGMTTGLVGAAFLAGVIAMSIAGAPVLLIIGVGVFGASFSVGAGLIATSSF